MIVHPGSLSSGLNRKTGGVEGFRKEEEHAGRGRSPKIVLPETPTVFRRDQGLPLPIEMGLIPEYGKEHKEMAQGGRVRARLERKSGTFRLKIRPDGRWKWNF